MALDEQRNPFDDVGRPRSPPSPADHPLAAPPRRSRSAARHPRPSLQRLSADSAAGSAAEANPFDAIGPAELAPYRAPTTAAGSALHEAERGVLPTIAGAGAFGPGAAGGAALGAFGGPLAPITSPAGALIGGLLTSTGAGYARQGAGLRRVQAARVLAGSGRAG